MSVRSFHPYSFPGNKDTHGINTARTVEVREMGGAGGRTVEGGAGGRTVEGGGVGANEIYFYFLFYNMYLWMITVF